MRALHVASTFARGGIASSLWHLLPELQAHGIALEIAGLYEIGLYGERLMQRHINATHLGFKSKYDARALSHFIRWVQRERFDLIHVHGWPPIFFVALAARAAPHTTFFVTEHSTSNRRRRYHLKFFERWMYRRYAQIIAVSCAAAHALRSWLPETEPRTRVIYNGLARARLEEIAKTSPALFTPQTFDAPFILSACGSEFHKGADVLLQAVSNWKFARPFTLALAGEGRREAELRERVRELGLDARTRWLGYVPDVIALMRDADVFVLPSRREGCPMVILEAMSVGTPIVACAVGGVPELIENEKSGLLVSPENSAALGEAILRVLDDRAFAQHLGGGAQQASQKFTAESQARQVAELYAVKKISTHVTF